MAQGRFISKWTSTWRLILDLFVILFPQLLQLYSGVAPSSIRSIIVSNAKLSSKTMDARYECLVVFLELIICSFLCCLHWPGGRNQIFVEERIMCCQTTSGLRDFVANMALVKPIQVDFNVTFQVFLPHHCLSTVAAAKTAIFISNNHRLESRVQVWREGSYNSVRKILEVNSYLCSLLPISSQE